jgi:hypothetical protein
VRYIIHNILQLIGMLYFGAAFVLVPILIYILWQLGADPRIDKMAAIAAVSKITLGLLGGYLLLKIWVKESHTALLLKIKSVAPPDFKPRFELHGCGTTEYIGMAPEDNIMIIVDMKKDIVRRESMNFYQGWYIEEDGSFTFITIRFNSFEFPSIKFQIPRKRKDEIIAKLNYAMQF